MYSMLYFLERKEKLNFNIALCIMKWKTNFLCSVKTYSLIQKCYCQCNHCYISHSSFLCTFYIIYAVILSRAICIRMCNIYRRRVASSCDSDGGCSSSSSSGIISSTFPKPNLILCCFVSLYNNTD